tara:strand:+ start:13391 stop:14545 length:1155 start_codon:yes stop_codon:yes gene_type:complete
MWPYYDDQDIKVVSEILRSGKVNYWTGNNCKLFEDSFSKYIGCKHSIALANGSFALTAAYKSIGLKSGDELITTPRTFLATASTAVLLGIKPVFADIEKDSGAIDPDNIESLITKKTKAISVVHLGGWPAQIQKIKELASSYNLKLIEDCSQAHGAKFYGRNVGTFGDVATWSFCQDKIISTGGEGGMLSTNNESIWKYALSFKDHGKNFDTLSSDKSNFGFKWIHDAIGTNMRLTEMQSAIGINQLKKLDSWIELREKNALILYKSLKECSSLRIPMPSNDIKNAWYRFYCYLKPNSLLSDWNRERIIMEIKNLDVDVFSGSCSEIYLEKCFQKLGYAPMERLRNAKELGETSLAFLVHPTISDVEQNKKAQLIKSVINKASR